MQPFKSRRAAEHGSYTLTPESRTRLHTVQYPVRIHKSAKLRDAPGLPNGCPAKVGDYANVASTGWPVEPSFRKLSWRVDGWCRRRGGGCKRGGCWQLCAMRRLQHGYRRHGAEPASASATNSSFCAAPLSSPAPLSTFFEGHIADAYKSRVIRMMVLHGAIKCCRRQCVLTLLGSTSDGIYHKWQML